MTIVAYQQANDPIPHIRQWPLPSSAEGKRWREIRISRGVVHAVAQQGTKCSDVRLADRGEVSARNAPDVQAAPGQWSPTGGGCCEPDRRLLRQEQRNRPV